MDKIRLGNDIEMRWSIFTRNGDNKVPYNLEGRALTLSVVNRTGESEIEFFAEGNIVTGVFRGRDQRILGKHGVILRENNGKDGMRTIDACDAFELVACSCEEALGSSGTIQLFHLTFDSTIGAITGTIDPILNYEAEQAEAERKANEIIRKANEGQRIDNEKQRNVNEILRNTAEEERESAEQERIVKEDLRKADEAERKTNEESRLQSESERISSEEERLYAESIRVANENARIASEAKRAEAETARIEAEDKRIVSEKNRLSAESSRIANEDSRRANEDSRLSAEAKRVSNEEERQIAEEERKAKFASMVVQSTGDATDKVMSQKSVTEALKGKQNKLTAGEGISIDGDVISATLDMDIVRVVDALPSVGEANIIYLVPAEQPSESDLFEEWVWTDKWERIGSAKMDLSNYATKTELATKANLQHKHTVADITDFPELYYDATAFFASGAYPSDKYEELLEAVKAKKTVYATIDEEGYVSYVFFMSLANSDASSSHVLLTTIFVDGSYLYLNTFVLRPSGMTRMQENITSKANKATTLAGYGIGDAYTKSEVDAALKGKQDTLTPITYAELVALRDSSSLVAGMQYRITDYACTTTQENTQSAGHPFDIIVTADSENTLNEEARAIQHEGDTYFADCDLNAWKIWYCLDNDATRFAWADSVNGKGVIYRMIDEWNNDVPYDFKNIMYNGSWGYWAYTFNWINDESDNTCEDLSVAQYVHTNDEEGYSHTYGNIIKPYGGDEVGNYGSPCQLNACVFLHNESYDIGNFYGCSSNIFGIGCNDNTFGNYCVSNIFGDKCFSNTFGDICSYNTLWDNCSYNTFQTDCSYNVLMFRCNTIILGDNCSYNIFGIDCNDNTFWGDCSYNTFGDFCAANTLGAGCHNNTFGNNCNFISFASSSSATTKYNYYRQNHFGDGCQYILFKGAETASDSAQVQNYKFAQGLQGTPSAYLTINGVRSRAYETKVAKNSSGELKIYCEADLIQ